MAHGSYLSYTCLCSLSLLFVLRAWCLLLVTCEPQVKRKAKLQAGDAGQHHPRTALWRHQARTNIINHHPSHLHNIFFRKIWHRTSEHCIASQSLWSRTGRLSFTIIPLRTNYCSCCRQKIEVLAITPPSFEGFVGAILRWLPIHSRVS